MAKDIRKDKEALDKTVQAAGALLGQHKFRKKMEAHQRQLDKLEVQLSAGKTSGETEPDAET